MKASELKGMSEQDLNKKLVELRKELAKHGTSIASGVNPKSPGQVKKTKKTIARILTFINSKKLIAIKKAESKTKEAKKE